MAFTARPLWIRATVNGAVVPTTGVVRISAALDQLARVAEFSLAAQPAAEPAAGDPVLLEWCDFGADRRYALFGGAVNAVEVESEPWAYTIRATDQLALLRRVRTSSDLSLVGLTEGAAWKAVMDFCGVGYAAGDVADSGYVLGARAPVSWQIDVPGAAMVGELDRVFGMATMTVGDDRVIRFPYDPVPADGTGAAKTYTRGTDLDFRAHHRAHGDRDRIQNVWVVRGVTAEIDQNCSATPWGRAVITNPQLGGHVRVATATFGSDLIQSEDLAAAIARRQMRLTNRLPDEASAGAVGDPNVHPGAKLAVTDPAYGIDAAPRYYTVTAVDREGTDMILSLVAGPPGAEGVVTSGVDKVCNDTHSGLSWPGAGWDFPAFGFPPLDLGLPGIAPPIGGWTAVGGTPPGGGGGPPLACMDVPAAGWVVDAGSIGDFTFGAGLVSSPNAGAAHSEGAGMGIPAGTSWTLRGTVFADPNNSTQIAMGVDGLAFQYAALVKGSLESIPGVELDTLVDSQSAATDFSGAACPVVLAYDAVAQTLTCTFNGVLTLVCSDAGSGVTGTLYPCVRVYDLGLNPLGTGQVSSFQFCTGGEGEVLSPAWHIHYGGWTFVDPSEAHFVGVADAFCGGAAGGAFSGYAYGDGTGMPFDGTQRVRFSGRIAIGGTLTDAAFFVGLQATDETGDSCGFDWGTGTDAFNAYGFPDGGFAAATIPLPSPFDFAVDVDPAAGTISFLLTDPTATATLYAGSLALGTWPAAARSPVFSASGNHCACTFDATDVTVRSGG